jgi:hypothetical protein
VAGADRMLAGLAAVVLGLAYGLCLFSGLRQAEQMAGVSQRGAVVACYYALDLTRRTSQARREAGRTGTRT